MPQFREERRGRAVTFLMPSLQLKKRDDQGRTVEERVHQFLLDQFGGYTAAAGNIFGYWKDDQGKPSYGEHKEYKVALVSEEKAPVLKEFLARMTAELGEECLYVETGEEASFLYPSD